MLLYFVETTNAYAEKKLSTMMLSPCSLYRTWRPVTVDEMKGFLAVILNMGIVQLTNLKDYWSTDDTTNFPFFRSVFSDIRNAATKRDKIQPFLDRLCSVFERTFTPSQEIAVDESVVSFKGRASFHQYLKGNPTPLGYQSIHAIRQQDRIPSESVCVLRQGDSAR